MKILGPYLRENQPERGVPYQLKLRWLLLFTICQMKGDTGKLQMLSGFLGHQFLLLVRRVCAAISEYFGPSHVRLPTSEREVQELVSQFHVYHGFPQCMGAIDGTHIPIKDVLLNEFDKVNNTTIKYKLDLIRICQHMLQLRSCDKTNMAVSKNMC